MEKSKESKEIFKIHIEGPDTDEINEHLKERECTGFLLIPFYEQGFGIAMRNTDKILVALALSSDDDLRAASTLATFGKTLSETLKSMKPKEDEDGKEN